nr:hypothetical protein [Tanacetum cinerariifolium]
VDGAVDLIRTIDALVRESIIGGGGGGGSGVNIVGDTAVGSGCSSAGNTTSAGGRYSGYSGP